MKICSKCKVPKELTDFHVDRVKKNGRCSSCKVCSKERASKFYHNHRIACDNYTYSYYIKKLYGITLEEKNDMFLKQGNCCGACGSKNIGNIQRTRWCIDHDHKTGLVRGVLCYHCNAALGQVKDDISTLKKLIEYLERHDATKAKMALEPRN